MIGRRTTTREYWVVLFSAFAALGWGVIGVTTALFPPDWRDTDDIASLGVLVVVILVITVVAVVLARYGAKVTTDYATFVTFRARGHVRECSISEFQALATQTARGLTVQGSESWLLISHRHFAAPRLKRLLEPVPAN